jgi:hypothetical protein
VKHTPQGRKARKGKIGHRRQKYLRRSEGEAGTRHCRGAGHEVSSTTAHTFTRWSNGLSEGGVQAWSHSKNGLANSPTAARGFNGLERVQRSREGPTVSRGPNGLERVQRSQEGPMALIDGWVQRPARPNSARRVQQPFDGSPIALRRCNGLERRRVFSTSVGARKENETEGMSRLRD